MSVRAVIVPGSGANYGSLREACRRIGVDAGISDDRADIEAATHVLLPGVGAAAHAMRNLRERGLDRVLRELTQPLLGICLGMQLLFESSEESLEAPASGTVGWTTAGRPATSAGRPAVVQPTPADSRIRALMEPLEQSETPCLGLLPGRVLRLPAAPSWPHMGWNRMIADQPAHPLLAGISPDDWFYFVHGYAAPVNAQTLAHSEHGAAFTAIVARGNVHGVQFHPEKSAAAGRRLLANFFALA